MALIYQGKEIPTPGVTVIDWRTHGLTWRMGECGTRSRTEPLTQYVHHWTGADNGYKAVFSTLTNRGLSVQLFNGADGIIYQYVDLDTVCAHAGSPTNGRAIGIEQQNVGHGAPNPKVPRVRVPETVHGKSAMTSQFLPAQVRAAQALRRAIMSIIPVNVLPDTTVVSLITRNKFIGDLGHYQISDQKRDPSPNFMHEIAAVRP